MEHKEAPKNRQDQNADERQKKAASAERIDSIISSPTDAVRSRRHTDTWSNNGTNISYEGNTAPGAGGSVGTGNASGTDAVDARTTVNDAYEAAAAGNDDKGKAEQGRDEDLDPEHEENMNPQK